MDAVFALGEATVNQVLQAILVNVLEGNAAGVGFKVFVQLLGFVFSFSRARDERAFAVLIHNPARRGLSSGYDRFILPDLQHTSPSSSTIGASSMLH